MSASNVRIPPSASIPTTALHRITVDLFLGPVAIALVLFLSVLVPVRDAQAQSLGADGLSWGVTKSAPDTASVNNGALAIATTFAVAVTWYGVKNITPVGRVVSVGASVAGPIIANMLRTAQAAGKIAGSPAMLALALALGGANLNYDPGSNQFLSPNTANKPNGSTVDYTSTGWWTTSQNFGRCYQASPCDALTAAQVYMDASQGAGKFTVYSITLVLPAGVIAYVAGKRNSDGQIFNNVLSISRATSYTEPPATYVPSTDAQLATAASTPAALAKVWDAASDSDKDQLIGGGVPGTPTFPNGDTMQFPPRTTTGAGTDGQGRPMNGTFTMVPSVKLRPNTGADAIKNPVLAQPSQVNSWNGTDAVGNPVNGSNTTTYPTQAPTASAGSNVTVNVDTCGLPGKAPCKIDEAGTPTMGNQYVQPTTDLGAARADAVQKMNDVAKQTDFGFKMPTLLPGGSCQPIQFFKWKDFDGTVDLCAKLGFIRTLLSWLWGALAAIYIYNRVSSANA